MSKKILVLGAGLVAAPLVKHLLKKNDFEITVADMIAEKAKKLVEGSKNGKSVSFSIDDKARLKKEIERANVVVSLLPATCHMDVAEICLETGRDLFTTSYVKPAMREMEGKIREKELLFMNEVGLDPGIDHMSAMRVFDRARESGGKIISFKSYCGGLPAPEANTNPWGYKFSWSPKGVLLAAKNDAKYKKDGKIVEVPGKEIFSDSHMLKVEGLGDFEAYPNRDSLSYIDIYGLKDIETMYRGTLRNKGWCETWRQVHKVWLLDDREVAYKKGAKYADFMAELVRAKETKNIKKDVAKYLEIDEKSHPMEWFDWLGLFAHKKIGVENAAPIDIFADLMLKKCSYSHGERDMVILVHEFVIDYKGKREKTTSTMIDYGIPNGDSSMSRTVGLTCAIAVRLFLEGKIKATGVKIPVEKSVYEPILGELEKENIKFVENLIPLPHA